MIWVEGEIVPDESFRVSALDRAFEHGLGLFETLRTWKGHPTLLNRHLARLARSARELGLPLDPGQFPDHSAVSSLLNADGRGSDALLRITLSGGTSETAGSVLWMRSGPLPPPLEQGAIVGGSWHVERDDPLARHKTLNYWRRRMHYEQARAEGLDEALSVSRDRRVWEGTRTNLFVVVGPSLSTPPLDGPLVPGIMRALTLEHATALLGGPHVSEGDLRCGLFDLKMIDEAFLTNAVRGIVPIRKLFGRKLTAPGPITQRLWDRIRPWLESGGVGS